MGRYLLCYTLIIGVSSGTMTTYVSSKTKKMDYGNQPADY